MAFSGGKVAYNEGFREGVNIIRGENSSGKSTIADFIFLALGGDVFKWKEKASLCDIIFAELLINGEVLTVKRAVSERPQEPLAIFWGDIKSALSSAATDWQIYPFRRSEKKESFSQVLFRAANLPEVKSDLDSNITLHQLLRLIYVDQMSSPDSLFRNERFDTSLIRTTVGELLVGVYDDTLYSDQIMLREKQHDLEGVTEQYNAAQGVLKDAGHETNFESIAEAILQTEKDLLELHEKIKQSESLKFAVGEAKIKQDYSVRREAYMKSKMSYAEIMDEVSRFEFEIEDSKQFISNLESRLLRLREATIIADVIEPLPFTCCPECYQPLNEKESDNICLLCGQEVADQGQSSKLLRLQQELALQIKESKLLLVGKEKHLFEMRRQIPERQEQLESVSRKYNEMINSVKYERDRVIDDLYTNKGALESKLVYLHRQAKAVGVLEDLIAKKISFAKDVAALKISISKKQMAQQGKYAKALALIEKHALYLLHHDLPREEAFVKAEKVEVDFCKNTFSVDDVNHFSASSMTYLKNVIHFSIFFASCELEFFRYPRLIICDNMEDKGMQPDRSQNFQKLVVQVSKSLKVEHQIIFTTSMIAPDLNDTALCIGTEYSKDNKSLYFSGNKENA